MSLTDWIISEQCSNTFVFDLFDEPKWLNILAEWWLTDLLIFKIVIAPVLCNQRLIQNSFPEEQKNFKPPMSDSYHWGKRGGRNGTEDCKKSFFCIFAIKCPDSFQIEFCLSVSYRSCDRDGTCHKRREIKSFNDLPSVTFLLLNASNIHLFFWMDSS